ncbi:YfkD famly protein [Virgibacillus alimentarius]|uniref:YfkD-like protein n=1 Tax=Virgibacillus alimentarius TaxID=698769 RepID=A0ABS4SD75_9BACI|nr:MULTISPECIES: YfkD famly protein [Virgibacillus]MBP2259051.1 hypothetical protein [Virgibacillus alimentarius]HLR67497.1 YfkD family protein [Virgibacillus sp.]
MKRRYYLFALLLLAYTCLIPLNSIAAEKEKKKEDFKIPSHVLSISKENTFPNSAEDQEVVEPSALTKDLLKKVEVPIENPDLIKMLNETTLKPSPIAVGYRGMIYVGRWPLNYQSSDTNINWEYQQINSNELNNIGGEKDQEIYYNQQEQRNVKGALTNKISDPEDVKKMMLLRTKEKTNLPLSYQSIIGKDTKKDNSYTVPIKKSGSLKAYAPAVNEKGKVTFGEVYIQLKGSKKTIVVKNVTKQGIGAWIPIQDHVSFSFQLK